MGLVFDAMRDVVNLPVGYKQVGNNMVFSIKMGYFRGKYCFVAGGHMKYASHPIKYSSVVSQENICISLVIHHLNDLEV